MCLLSVVLFICFVTPSDVYHCTNVRILLCRYIVTREAAKPNSYCDVVIPGMVTQLTYKQPVSISDKSRAISPARGDETPCLSIESSLCTLALPIEREDLCHYGALALADHVPFYRY